MNAIEVDGAAILPAHRLDSRESPLESTGFDENGGPENGTQKNCVDANRVHPNGAQTGALPACQPSTLREIAALQHAQAAPIAQRPIPRHSAQSSAGRLNRRRRTGLAGFGRWLAGILLVGAMGFAIVAGRHASSGEADGVDALTVPVTRGDLVVTLTEDGQVESATNVNVKCDVPGPIRVLELVDDGTQVQQGDVLAKLDSSSIEDEILA